MTPYNNNVTTNPVDISNFSCDATEVINKIVIIVSDGLIHVRQKTVYKRSEALRKHQITPVLTYVSVALTGKN